MSNTTVANQRAFTREQAYDWIKSAVSEVNKPIAEELESLRLKAEEQSKATGDIRSALQSVSKQTSYKYEDPFEEKPKGLLAAGYVRCLAASINLAKRGTTKTPLDIAHEQYGEDHAVTKQLEASSATGGGFLIEGQVSQELINVLRATAVVEQAGPRRVPLDSGTLTIPKMTAGASGGWLGEGENLTHTAPTFGNVNLTARKYGALVAISNDLLRFASVDVDRMVRDDLIRDISTALDLAYIRGDGTAAQPRGFAHFNNINTFSANTTVNLANVTNDIGRAIQELMDDNVMITNASWIMAPRSWRYLFTVRDGNGNLAFQPELNQGSIFGFRNWITTQIPTNLGGGSDSEVYFVNMDDIVVGMATTIQVDASQDAAYHDGSNVVAAFSTDRTVIRAFVLVDINARYDQAVNLMDTVRWAS